MALDNSQSDNLKDETTSYDQCSTVADVAVLTKIKGSKLEQYVNNQIY